MNNQIQFSSFFLQTKNWLFPFLIILSGCDLEEGENKPCPTGPFPYYTFSEEFKRYCVFPDSSYWIYRDSISGDLDSIVKIWHYCQERIFFDACKDSYFRDYCEYEFFSSLTAKLTNDSGIYLATSFSERENFNMGYLYGISAPIPGYYNKLKPGNKTHLISLGNEITYEKFYDSLKLNNIIYNKVKIFKGQDNVRGVKRGSRSFWAENVGIIRMEAFGTDDTLILNLERYKIKQ